MKLGIIGCSGHYGYVINSLSKNNVTVEAISKSFSEENIEPVIKRLKELKMDVKLYDNWQELIEKSCIDAVCVDSRFDLHSKIAIEALKRGLHVFCEKPLAITLEELKKLYEIWEKSGKVLVSMLGLRYDPVIYTCARLVHKGAIGNVRTIHTQKSYKLGTRPAFYKNRATFGGTIPWVGSHAIDWIRWISKREFVSVNARHSTKENFNHQELEVTAMCLFELEDETFATLSIDYLRPSKAATHGDDRIRIVGTEGIIEVSQGKVSLMDGNGERFIDPQCNTDIFSEFVANVQGKSSEFKPLDSFMVDQACLLARLSADEKREVCFKEEAVIKP